MRKLRAFLLRLAGWARAQQSEGDFAAELESHIAMDTEEGVRAGLTPEEARRQALVRIGGAEQARQRQREQRTLPWLENLLRDLRYALRGFRRNPIFAITAIATLALGIGATTAVFSVVDRILFRSLPYAHDDRLVSFGLSQPLEPREFTLGFFFFDWRDHQRPFEAVTYERGVDECNITEQNPIQMQCARIASNFLSTLGITPVLGREFTSEEDQPQGPPVMLISYALWRERYNRDPGILEKSIAIDGRPTRIVGVLPQNFEMPRLQHADIALPARVDLAHQRTENAGLGAPLWAFARLKRGVSVAQAYEQMQPLFQQMRNVIPAQFRNEFHLTVRSLRDRQMQDEYRAAWLLFAAVLAVLLISCANVASLMAARSAARERERTVRIVLGASRRQLLGQALAESGLLAATGAATGCLLAWGLLQIFVALAPTGVLFLTKAHLDPRIFFFAALLTLVCTGICGILPTLQKPRSSALTPRVTSSKSHTGLRRTLVIAQIGICVILLSSASLLVESFRNLETQSLGMNAGSALVVHVSLTRARYTSSEAYMNFFLRAESILRGLPGISAVGISDSIPPASDSWHDEIRYPDLVVSGRPRTPGGVGGKVGIRRVTPDYFAALGIPLQRGRLFHEEDRHQSGSEIVLSRTLAARLFPQEDPIGQHIQIATYMPYFVLNGPLYTVVGVVDDVKNAGLSGLDDPEFYTLRRNRPEDWSNRNELELRTELPVSTIAPWIRAQIAHLDPTAPVEVVPMQQAVSRLADRPRFQAALISFFALCGLLLSVIGLYGVIAFIAAQRTQEIGVRMALGATRIDILRLITVEGLRLIVFGGALGLAASLATARLLQSLLFHVSTRDPLSYIAVTILLGLVALCATVLPAIRAMKTDPMAALRAE